MYLSVYRFVLFVFVCVSVCILHVWVCDRHNETSQQRLLGRQSILLTKVCDCSPPCLCASREAVEAEPGKAGTHSRRASLMLAFAVFYMICDKIMSLNSIPEKKSHMGCKTPVYHCCGEG